VRVMEEYKLVPVAKYVPDPKGWGNGTIQHTTDEQLTAIGAEGWVLFEVLKMGGDSYRYLFRRRKPDA
jgi:hypothetical protein